MEYMNVETMEIMNRKQMLNEWAEVYDGDDPLNIFSMWEHYNPIIEIYGNRYPVEIDEYNNRATLKTFSGEPIETMTLKEFNEMLKQNK